MYFKLIALNGRFIHSCLALFYVRDGLEQNLVGCRTEITQYTINDPYYRTLQQIGDGEPDGIFFSVYIWNSIYIRRLLRDLVKLLPDRPIILGGPQAQALARDLDREIPHHCSVITGEIEGIDQQFYRDLAAARLQREYGCAKAPSFGMVYRREDFATHLKNRNIYYESSRGCPFHCTYCLSAADKGVRHLALAQVYEEMQETLRHEPKVIRFVDRTFNDLPERALAIWRFLLDQPGRTLFHFELAPDRFTDEMFSFLEQVEPGRFQFELGIQSTNQQTLEAINRKQNPAKLSTCIRRLVALDTIHIHLDLILGLPYEDRESFARSFNDVFRFGPHYIQMGLLKVLPDTPICGSIEEFGLVTCEEVPHEILANRWLDADELAELYWLGECFESFYNNRFFRSFWTYLQQTEEDVFVFFQSLLALCRRRNFFERARTQELLSSLLAEGIQERDDSELLKELLVFDWLRCGHRFLPAHLKQAPSIAEQRKILRHQMDLRWEGVYDYRTRDEFFKQGVFCSFSEQLLQEAGIRAPGGSGYIVFLPGREKTVFRLNRFKPIPASVLPG